MLVDPGDKRRADRDNRRMRRIGSSCRLPRRSAFSQRLLARRMRHERRPPPKPTRIVSLELCTDQLLIELVERERIAAVTHLAADPGNSAIPEKAKGIPVTRGAAEDVLRHDPDLVLAGPFGVAPTVDLLRRMQRNVVVVPQAADLDGVRAAVRAVAAAVGEEARGEAMVARFDRRLASLPPAGPGPAPSAVIYEIGGGGLGRRQPRRRRAGGGRLSQRGGRVSP